MNFTPESEYVIAPTSAYQIRGKIKHNEKLGFTVMVGCELNSLLMLPLFIVFTTKIKDARRSK